LLIYAGKLMEEGVAARRACEVAIVWSLTDDQEIQRSVMEVVTSVFP
jgi:nitric oxide reductase NorQ protein